LRSWRSLRRRRSRRRRGRREISLLNILNQLLGNCRHIRIRISSRHEGHLRRLVDAGSCKNGVLSDGHLPDEWCNILPVYECSSCGEKLKRARLANVRTADFGLGRILARVRFSARNDNKGAANTYDRDRSFYVQPAGRCNQSGHDRKRTLNQTEVT
jgi:hypothetical protein